MQAPPGAHISSELLSEPTCGASDGAAKGIRATDFVTRRAGLSCSWQLLAQNGRFALTDSSSLGLTSNQSERAAGVLLATAAGDALGAGYEFGPPLPADQTVVMAGGGTFGWQPGEWTDDTAMAIAIAEVTADGADLRTAVAQDRIAARWVSWATAAKDVGNQTRHVLSTAQRAAADAGRSNPSASELRAAATALHQRTGKTAGNGSLMRTAPVALAYLDDPDALAEAAAQVSGLTHADPEAGEACILWCLAIRHAVLHGTFDGVHGALDHLPVARRNVWASRLRDAEERDPSTFGHNGWVVEALQAAWSAIIRTPVPDEDPGNSYAADHLRLALEAAVRGGRDTDTVAAIAGGLLGGRWGASAVPAHWRRRLHGWPGLRARDLIRLGWLTAHHGRPDDAGWPTGSEIDYSSWPDRGALAKHPHDDGVWLSGVETLKNLPDGVDAVVSLCRLGADQVPATGVDDSDHIEVWLIDSPKPAMNLHLNFVLNDAVDAIAELRAEGRTVLVHCVQAQSRTPTVAAIYGARLSGMSAKACLADIQRVLPSAQPNTVMLAALDRVAAGVTTIK